MRFNDLREYGLDVKSPRLERDPLRLREDIVRADLLDELHGIRIFRRSPSQPVRRRER